MAEKIVKDSQGLVKELVNDTISRQAAIDVADAVWSVTGDKNVAKVWDQIKDLPSAQPQRMRGKWAYGEDEYGIDGYHCDKCGFFVPWDYTHKFINYIEDYKFCPSCGARMRGASDE